MLFLCVLHLEIPAFFIIEKRMIGKDFIGLTAYQAHIVHFISIFLQNEGSMFNLRCLGSFETCQRFLH